MTPQKLKKTSLNGNLIKEIYENNYENNVLKIIFKGVIFRIFLLSNFLKINYFQNFQIAYLLGKI